MKKLLTAALAGAATLTCAFAFTACGGNEETSYTVTAEEWETAITSLYDCKHSVEASSTFVGGEADNYLYHYQYDNANKAMKLTIDYTAEANSAYTMYFWVTAEGKYYQYLDGEGKEEIEKEAYETVAMSYTGNGLPYALAEDKDAYANATYDETSKEYKGTSNQGRDSFTYTLKFENKKLVKLSAEISNLSITVEYKYENISVTITDEIKNLPVNE